MILVTVGTQLPFDRLIQAVDAWAAANPSAKIVAQTGNGRHACRHIEARPYLSPSELDALYRQASLVVAHAGMGSILGATIVGKPVLVMPRRHDQGEHRNDHQTATARHLASRPGVHVAWTVEELHAALDRRQQLKAGGMSPTCRDKGFIRRLSQIIAAA